MRVFEIQPALQLKQTVRSLAHRSRNAEHRTGVTGFVTDNASVRTNPQNVITRCAANRGNNECVLRWQTLFSVQSRS